jgi:hypothetical protein
MARKQPTDRKPPTEKNPNTQPTSVRLSPGCHATIDELQRRFQLTRVASIEAGTRLLLEALDTAKPARARKLVESGKKPGPTP